MLQSNSLLSNLFFDSFHAEKLQLHENKRFQPLLPCLTSVPVKESNSKFEKSLMNWIGASILGATMELNDERWVHRSVYLGDEGGDEDIELEAVPNGTDDGGIVFDWMTVRK